MEKLAQVFFLVGLVVWFGWVLSRRFLNPGAKGTAAGEQVSDDDVRRHISAMRQDLSMLAVTNFATLLVLVFALVLKL